VPGRAPSFLVLVLLSGISPLATDMYLAGLPALGRALHTSASAAQLSLTAFLIGLAVGQIVLGPVSDAFGRRVLLLAGPAAFVVASVVCAVAPNATVLIAARLVQGFVGAAGMVCAPAVVSDYYTGDDATRRFGLITAVSLLAPIVAPPLGTLLLRVGDWRLIFWVLAAVGVVQLVGAWFGIPETLPPAERHSGSVPATLARTTDLLRDRTFMTHVAVAVLAIMGFFAYIGGSSFVLETVYGLSAGSYGLIFAVNAVCMAVASALFSRLFLRWPVARLRLAGLVVSCGSALVLVVASLVAGPAPPLALVWVALAGVAAGMGLTLPASMTLSQQAGQRAKGTASALSGGLSFAFGALTTPVTGVLGGSSVLPMALVMAGFLLAAVAVARTAGR
jgi:DHA1 family bicyclomycin/chloramphenicol resistance-like MFS transporter